MDGFLHKSIKSISFASYKKWISAMNNHQKEMDQPNKKLFIIGEYFSRDVNPLTNYLNVTDYSLTIFDLLFHFNNNLIWQNYLISPIMKSFFVWLIHFFDMAKLFDIILFKFGKYAVTFVDNHTTQSGQALFSFISQ